MKIKYLIKLQRFNKINVNSTSRQKENRKNKKNSKDRRKKRYRISVNLLKNTYINDFSIFKHFQNDISKIWSNQHIGVVSTEYPTSSIMQNSVH